MASDDEPADDTITEKVVKKDDAITKKIQDVKKTDTSVTDIHLYTGRLLSMTPDLLEKLKALILESLRDVESSEILHADVLEQLEVL